MTLERTPPFRWPHTVITYSPDSQHQSLDSPTDGKKGQSQIKTFVKEVDGLNRVLKLVDRHETVFCPDVLANIASSTKAKEQIEEAVRSAPYLTFVLLTSRPDALPGLLPVEWTKKGRGSVCIAAVLDGSAPCGEILGSFRTAAISHKALILRGLANPTLEPGWHTWADWVIIDPPDPGTATSDARVVEWVKTIREACTTFGVAFHALGMAGGEWTPENSDGVIPAAHPFGNKIDLARPSLPKSGEHKGSGFQPVQPSLPETVEEIASQPEVSAALEDLAPVDGGSPDNYPPRPEEISFPAEVPKLACVAPPMLELELVVGVPTNRERFLRLDAVVREGINASIKAGIALLEIREEELWREGGSPSWDEYCSGYLNNSRSYVTRIINGALIVQNLSNSKLPVGDDGEPILPKNECQTRALGKLKGPKEQSKAWREAIKRASGVPTTATITEVVCELMAESPQRKPPSAGRKEQRVQLISQLRKAAEEHASWDSILTLITSLERLS
jgi:hypothetical protein